MANLFVKTPLPVLEANMPATHKIGIQWLMYTCWHEKCATIRGTYRGLAKLLHLAKSSFIKRILPAWVAAGWVTAQYDGREVTLTLLEDQIYCPTTGQLGTSEQSSDASTVPSQATHVPPQDTFVPPRDKVGPSRDKSVPPVSSKESTVRRESTETLPEESREEENVTCLLKKEEWDTIPELTPELGLELVREVLPVPPRPKSGSALDQWMQRWYDPMVALIASMRPMTGPLAWAELDEIIRFMASPESGWTRKMGRLPTLENVAKNRDIQVDQMARQGWQPNARTPYPGLPEAEEQEWPTQGQEERGGIRNVQPFASRAELVAYADALMEANPTLQLSIDTSPGGPGPLVLVAQYGPEDYFCLDAEIWNQPTPEELALIYQALDYGYSLMQRQPEAVAI